MSDSTPNYRIERVITIDPHSSNPVNIVTDATPKFRTGAAMLVDIFTYDNGFKPTQFDHGKIKVLYIAYEIIDGVERKLTADEAALIVEQEHQRQVDYMAAHYAEHDG